MTKAPIAGQVKTRLCPPLREREAAELHECFLLDTLENCRWLDGVRLVVAYSPDVAEAYFARVAGDGWELIPQEGQTLGARMLRCLEALCAPDSATVMVGTDSPTLPLESIRSAFEVLECGDADLVLGPSTDGGYCLIGMTEPHPRLFDGIDWSTDRVLRQTLDRAADMGLLCRLLPEWYDIDLPADLARLKSELATSPESRVGAPHTAEWLGRMADRARTDMEG